MAPTGECLWSPRHLLARLLLNLLLTQSWLDSQSRQLPDLHATFVDSLIAAGISSDAAHCFKVEVASSAGGVPSRASVSNPQCYPPSANSRDGGGSRVVGSIGLDAADVHALSDLRVRFVAEWPLPLAISDQCLLTHERIFNWLLRLRRARWALETCESKGGMSDWRCAHPWRVLRSEVCEPLSPPRLHGVAVSLHRSLIFVSIRSPRCFT